MKPFRTVVLIKQPLETLWATVRDRLPEIAALLDDIESVDVMDRELVADGRVRLVNRWTSAQRVPALLQGRLGTGPISWIDRNEWDDSTRSCTWRIEPSILTDQIRCVGTTVYEPAMGGRGTRVAFSGEFELASGAVRGIAGPLELPVSAFIESVVTILVPRNLHRVMEAAGKIAVS